MTTTDDQARAEAVEAIKEHLTDRYVDHDAEEIAWNVLNIAADIWREQEAAARAETTTACDHGGELLRKFDGGRIAALCEFCMTILGYLPEARTAAPTGLTVSEDGSVLNWQGVNYVRQQPETTAATPEDAEPDTDNWRLDDLAEVHRLLDEANAPQYAQAANRLTGLLATARTSPTRDDVARAIFLADRAPSEPSPGFSARMWDGGHAGDVEETYHRRADAVLALYGQQPETTTEWGTRSPHGETFPATSEREARHSIKDSTAWTAVRREVTAWTEVDR